jgi:hypothetical protein
LGIENFYFLNKSFLFMECLKSAPGANVSKTLILFMVIAKSYKPFVQSMLAGKSSLKLDGVVK